MSNNNSEIPCSVCRLWNSEKKSFSCNPDKCAKLSEWLLDHTSLGEIEHSEEEIHSRPVIYIV